MVEEQNPAGAGRRAQLAWCSYDWANSAFPTIIVTFIFATYFTKSVAADQVTGTVQWGYAVSVSGIAIALLSPVCGAISDHSGPRKPWLGALALVTIAGAALTWFVRPDPAYALLALALLVIANTAFEIGNVFYNAMLVDLAPPEEIGRLSGWGWGLGYFGGLCCLILAYFAFIAPETPLFGLDTGPHALQHVRINGPVVAVWYAAFALPLFLYTPDRARAGLPVGLALRRGVQTLWSTLVRVRQYGNVARFLLARLVYTDGLNTLFAFGAIYAAGTFGLGVGEIFRFAIALNVTAGIGAIGFGYVDDRLGSKTTIVIALVGLIAFGVPLLLVEGKLWFWLLAAPLGLFMGPAQAASRTMMARLAPADMEAEMFGLYAFSGKATAFIGPAALAWVTDMFQSQRAGMATIIAFLAAGLLLLLPVRERKE